MSNNRAFLWLFVLFLAQNALHYVFLRNTPPLLLVGVVFYGLSGGPVAGLAAGCFAGVFLELFSAGRIGWQMITLGLVGIAAGSLSTKLFREGLLTQILLPPLCNYLASILSLLVFQSSLRGGEALGWGIFFEAFSWPQAFLAAMTGPIIFPFLKRVSDVRPARAAVWR